MDVENSDGLCRVTRWPPLSLHVVLLILSNIGVEIGNKFYIQILQELGSLGCHCV